MTKYKYRFILAFLITGIALIFSIPEIRTGYVHSHVAGNVLLSLIGLSPKSDIAASYVTFNQALVGASLPNFRPRIN